MQMAYSPLISATQKTTYSVIKIPSSTFQASQTSKYSASQTSNSDNISRQNSQQYGEQKSFLERMGEENLAVQKTSGQRQTDPMQHTFASLAQPYQAASAQVKPSLPLLTPLYEFDIASEKSAVNPFSIANVNFEAESEEMVTAEGFFKNPSQVAKQVGFTALAKQNVQNRSSLPVEQITEKIQNNQASQISRKSEPLGSLNIVPNKTAIKRVNIAIQNKQTGSNLSNNSSGVYRIKRSQIEILPPVNQTENPSQQENSNFRISASEQNQRQIPPKSSQFPYESFWLDQSSKNPFEQTLKPAKTIQESLGIRKFPTQDAPIISHRHNQSLQNAAQLISDQKSNRSDYKHSKSLMLRAQNQAGLFSQQQERRRIINYDPLVQVEQVDRSPQSITKSQQQQRLETHQKRYSQERPQDTFRDVFSSGKHYRNTSEQKILSSEVPFSGFGVESPKNLQTKSPNEPNLNLAGGYAFKTAAKLGLLSQENMFRLNSAANLLNFSSPSIYQENKSLGFQQQFSQNQPINERQHRNIDNVGNSFQENLSLPVLTNEAIHQNHLINRKISSQGMMIPHQHQYQDILSHHGLNTAGKADMGFYQASIDHFPGPFASQQQTPVKKVQDRVSNGEQANVRSKDRFKNNSSQILREDDSSIYHNGLDRLKSVIATGYSPIETQNKQQIRPNVSKNMPLCFRENPSQRQRRSQHGIGNETLNVAANLFNDEIDISNRQKAAAQHKFK